MKKQKFTLLEVMIVLMLLVILAGAVTPAYMNYMKKSQVKSAQSQCKLIADAVDHYTLDVGQLPANLESLVRNSENLSRWNGPYLQGKLPKDPWGNAYMLVVPGREGEFDIVCYGSDGKSGGEGYAADLFSSDISQSN